MKNIHLLRTDKPSRLHTYLTTLPNYLFLSNEALNWKEAKQIYITSDEEIREGDWTLMFDDFGNLFLCDKPQQYLGIEKGHHLNKGLRKIILTTDQDLIKDGVQKIDDEFLEWFVKNPSCEEVEVDDKLLEKGYTYYRENILKNKNLYKIIIPKEEPKQRLEKYSERFDNDKSPIGNPETWGKRLVDDVHKQEIEEDVECNTCGNLMWLKEDESIYICTNSECTSYYDESEIPTEHCCDCNRLLEDCTCIEDTVDMKQKTLEEDFESYELAEKLFKEIYGYKPQILEGNQQHELIVAALQKGMVHGAKWQQEQDNNKFKAI